METYKPGGSGECLWRLILVLVWLNLVGMEVVVGSETMGLKSSATTRSCQIFVFDFWVFFFLSFESEMRFVI